MQVAEMKDCLEYIYIYIYSYYKENTTHKVIKKKLTWTQLRWNHASFLQQGAHKVFTKSLVLILS